MSTAFNLWEPYTYSFARLYDWTVQKPSAADSLGFDFWPMLWGGSQDMISAFESTVTAGYGTIILGFNE